MKEGEEISYYKNGKVLSKGNFTNGKENGEFTGYYKNGKVFSISKFVDGKNDGLVVGYYKTVKFNLNLIMKMD